MSGGGRTPIFSFDTPSRSRTPSSSRILSSSRSRGSSAREILNGVVPSDSNTPIPPSRSTASHVESDALISETVGSTEISNTPVINAVKHLREQQKKLQASSERIEEMLKQLTEDHGKSGASVTRHRIPRALSRIVHDVYDKLVNEEEERKWHLQESFDHISNYHVNTILIRNIQGVLKENEYDPTMIKRAVRTYFKSKKSYYQREQSGKKVSTAASSRKRQRKHNKARARLRVLNLSKNIDETMRRKVEPVLTADFMSSEDSEYEDVEQGQSSGSEMDDVQPTKKKKLIKHKLPWRSRELQSILDSLDRKMDRRRDARAKKMCLEVVMGEDSNRPKPDGMPEWAVELFS